MRCSALDVFVGLHLCICILLLDVGASLHVGVCHYGSVRIYFSLC